jgi:hypothetical protein
MYPPPYLIIKTRLNRFELCGYADNNPIQGTCCVKNDTLFLFPKRSYNLDTGLPQKLTYVDTLSRVFLMREKKTKLIEITDYIKYWRDTDLDMFLLLEQTFGADYWYYENKKWRNIFTLIK